MTPAEEDGECKAFGADSRPPLPISVPGSREHPSGLSSRGCARQAPQMHILSAELLLKSATGAVHVYCAGAPCFLKPGWKKARISSFCLGSHSPKERELQSEVSKSDRSPTSTCFLGCCENNLTSSHDSFLLCEPRTLSTRSTRASRVCDMYSYAGPGAQRALCLAPCSAVTALKLLIIF